MPKFIEIPDETWAKVRNDYCTSELSIRAVCKKYSVPYNQTLKRCKTELWDEKKSAFIDKSISKSIDLMSEEIANNVVRAYRLCNKVMDKLDEVVDMMDAKSPDVLRDIKDVTYSMKNLKEIGYFKASLDEQEQMARIEKLRKEAREEEKKDSTITVTFENAIDDYAD